MRDPRLRHTATTLNNGMVLVTGGWTPNGMLNSAELYDPSTGTWIRTGNMSTARCYHTASLLSNGKVLVAGGMNGNLHLSSAELYDHTASILSNGKVLVAGGGNNVTLKSTELYDPSIGTWTLTGYMSDVRI